MPFDANDPRNCFTQSAIMRLQNSARLFVIDQGTAFDAMRILYIHIYIYVYVRMYIARCQSRVIAPIAQLSIPFCRAIKFNRENVSPP